MSAGTEARALHAIWHRELLRHTRRPLHAALLLLQPFVLLLGVGTGLSGLMPATHGADYRAFLFPGMLLMAAQAPALATGITLTTERAGGVFQQMLIAPVRHTTVLLGKALGGTTVATCQAAALLTVAGAVGLPYHPALIGALLAATAVTAFALTALGLAMATTIRRPETFHIAMAALMGPMTLLSGMLFPTHALPTWLDWAVRLNPLSYAVDALRRITGAHLGATPPQLFTPLSWHHWQPPVLLELALLTAAGVICLTATARALNRAR